MRKKEYDAEKNDKVAIGLIIFNIVSTTSIFVDTFPISPISIELMFNPTPGWNNKATERATVTAIAVVVR